MHLGEVACTPGEGPEHETAPCRYLTTGGGGSGSADRDQGLVLLDGLAGLGGEATLEVVVDGDDGTGATS